MATLATLVDDCYGILYGIGQAERPAEDQINGSLAQGATSVMMDTDKLWKRGAYAEFATDGEDRHFRTAMASIYSKYVRELFMKAFNRYWGAQVATLKPTAGYYTDAKRWLAEVGPVLDELKIDRRKMVRSR